MNQLQRKLRIVARVVETPPVSQPPVIPAVPQPALPIVAAVPVAEVRPVVSVQNTPAKVPEQIPAAKVIPVLDVKTLPANVNEATETPAAVDSVPADQPSKRNAKPKKVKIVSLKAKALRLTSQFYLVQGSQEKFEKRKLVVAPGIKFTKVWKLRNESNEAWPEDTRLTFVQGDQEVLKVSTSTRVTPVRPSEEGEVTISGKAPKQPGKFSCTFRFYCNNKLCGRKLKIMVVVKEPRVEDNKEKDVAKIVQREMQPAKEFAKDVKQRVKKEKKPRKERNLVNAN